MADRNLLAAQAAGGTAGMQAYQQSQADINARKQAAVEAALRGNVLRGGPAAVAPALGDASVQGVDQISAQNSANQANFSGIMASRTGRMQDYMGAINEAATLIPRQAQAQVSVIKSQGDARLAQEQATYRNQLDLQAASAAARQQDRQFQELSNKQSLAERMWYDTQRLAQQERVAEARQAAADAKAAAAEKKAGSTLSGTALGQATIGTAYGNLSQKATDIQKQIADLGAEPGAVEAAYNRPDSPSGVGKFVHNIASAFGSLGGLFGKPSTNPAPTPSGPRVVTNQSQIDAANQARSSWEARNTALQQQLSQAQSDMNNPAAMSAQQQAAAQALAAQGFNVSPAAMLSLGGQAYKPNMSAYDYQQSMSAPMSNASFSQATGIDLAKLASQAGMSGNNIEDFVTRDTDLAGRPIRFNDDLQAMFEQKSKKPKENIGQALDRLGIKDRTYRAILTGAYNLQR